MGKDTAPYKAAPKLHEVAGDSDLEFADCPTTSGYNCMFKRPAAAKGTKKEGKKVGKNSERTKKKGKTTLVKEMCTAEDKTPTKKKKKR